MSPAPGRTLVALALLAPLSLELLALLDDTLGRWLPPSRKLLARVRLPALTVRAALPRQRRGRRMVATAAA